MLKMTVWRFIFVIPPDGTIVFSQSADPTLAEHDE